MLFQTDIKSTALQGRHFKFECVNRLYDVDNATIWTENLYGAGVRARCFLFLCSASDVRSRYFVEILVVSKKLKQYWCPLPA